MNNDTEWLSQVVLIGTNGSFWDDEKIFEKRVECEPALRPWKNRAILFNGVTTIGQDLAHCKNGGRLSTFVPWHDEPPHTLIRQLAFFACSRPQVQAVLDIDGAPYCKTNMRRLFVWVDTTDPILVHATQFMLNNLSKTDWTFNGHKSRKRITFKHPLAYNVDYIDKFNRENHNMICSYNECIVDDLLYEKDQTTALRQEVEDKVSELNSIQETLDHSASMLNAHRENVRLSTPNRPRSMTTGSAPTSLRYDCEKDAKNWRS